MQRLQQMLIGSSKPVLAAAARVMAILVLLGPRLITVVFGDAYAPSYVPMIILSLGHLIVASFGPIVIVANKTGHERATALIMGAGTLVNVCLNLALTPRFGIHGAAVATVASVALWRMVLHRKFRLWVGVRTSAIDRPRSS